MKILLFAFHLTVFALIIYGFAKKWNSLHRKLFWSALVYHLVAAISVGLVYTYYYQSNDTFFYFDTACQLSASAKENFLSYLISFFDSNEMLRINSIVVEDFRSIVF